MSTTISSACWKLEGIPSSKKFVLISLADQANDDGVCWPSVGSLSARTGLSERAVQEALSWLQKVGLVTRFFRRNTSTSYTIRPGSFRPENAPESRDRVPKVGADGAPGADSAPGADGAPVQMAHPRGADGAPLGEQMAHPNHHGTINEPSIKKARAQAPATTPVQKPVDVDDQVWADWLQLRKSKRAAVTQTVVDGARVEAGKADMSLEAFLRVWCVRGSQGLMADWLRPEERRAGASQAGESFREKDERLARERYEEATGQRRAPPVSAGFVVDVSPASGIALRG